MTFSIFAVILFGIALLGGGGLIVGSILAFKEHKLLGGILLASGILTIICPIVLYVLVLISTRGM